MGFESAEPHTDSKYWLVTHSYSSLFKTKPVSTPEEELGSRWTPLLLLFPVQSYCIYLFFPPTLVSTTPFFNWPYISEVA